MAVTQQQVAGALTYLAKLGLTAVGEASAAAWTDFINERVPGVTAEQLQAATRRAAEATEFPKVAAPQVVAQLRAIRQANLQRAGYLAPPDGLDVRGELTWLRAANELVASGMPAEQATARATLQVTGRAPRPQIAAAPARAAPNPPPAKQPHTRTETSLRNTPKTKGPHDG